MSETPIAVEVTEVEPDAAALETLEERWLKAARAIKKFAKSELMKRSC